MSADPHVRKLSISFSGGETSAFMTAWLLKNARERYDEIDVVFANTGQERDETLEFVERCDKHFGFGLTWIEAVVHHGERKACTHKVVDFTTATRHTQEEGPFKEYIKKYGIPNPAFPQCTSRLKTSPMASHRAGLGWERGTFHVAIGMRADEPDRLPWEIVAGGPRSQGLIYPLVESRDWIHVPGGMTKPQINTFWRGMPFRLNLKGYEGNCAWCWKKTLRKHVTLLRERPELYDFPERMEEQYRTVGPQECERVFFRGNRDTKALRKYAASATCENATDDSVTYPGKGDMFAELDVGGGCGESCEVFTDLESTWESDD